MPHSPTAIRDPVDAVSAVDDDKTPTQRARADIRATRTQRDA